MDYKNEVWKDIPGYNGMYQVSDHGRVWSGYKQRMFKQQVKRDGYLCVTLMKPNKRPITERVHRLVALCFCIKPEGCNIVNHLDMNIHNNHYGNLEWTTVKGNTKHAYENSQRFKETTAIASILGAEKTVLVLEVRKDRELIGTFKGIKEAANVLGINEKTVRNIKDNKFTSNRSGYEIKAISRGGVPIQ